MSLLLRLTNQARGLKPLHEALTPQENAEVEAATREMNAPVAVPETQPPLPSIKAILDRQDGIPEVQRVGGTKAGYIHASSLIDACPRREVLAAQHAYAPSFKRVTGAHRLVWAYGRAAEKHVRDSFIKANAQEAQLWGSWSCACGKEKHVGLRENIVCERCSGPLDEYEEVPVFNDDMMVVGNPDMPIHLGDDWFSICEIKSMNAPDWKELETPKGDHVLQVATYRRLRELDGWKMHSHATILYAVKEFRFGSPYKEFQVDCTSEMVSTMVDDLLAAGHEIAEHRKANTLPPRRVCQSPQNPVAKKCPMASLCFGMPSE